MQLDDRTIDDLLKHLPYKERQKYVRRLKNKIVKQVFCSCGDGVLAEIDSDGTIFEVDGRLLAHKTRIDGFYGFQCLCGNDSRQSVQEVGLESFGTPNPSNVDVEEALRRVKDSPSVYPIIDGVQHVDGFRIVEVSDGL